MFIAESSNTLRGPWLDTLGSSNVSLVIWFVVHEHCILGWCNDLDKTEHDNDYCRGCECVAPSLQTAHQALRFIGPSFCGFVDVVMQFGDLQSQGAGHPHWRRFGLRFHLQKLCSPCHDHCCDASLLSSARVRSLLVRCTTDSSPRDWEPSSVRAHGALLHWSS